MADAYNVRLGVLVCPYNAVLGALCRGGHRRVRMAALRVFASRVMRVVHLWPRYLVRFNYLPLIALSAFSVACARAPKFAAPIPAVSAKPRPLSAVSGAFLIGYGSFRFIAEYFREPDAGIFGQSYFISMGQWLSLPMVAVGLVMIVLAYRNKEPT